MLIEDTELGLAALEFSRAALRGLPSRLVIEVEEEPEILARIDVIRDVVAPTAEQRREAILHEDILYRLRKQASRLQRALLQLLTESALADKFGYRDELLAYAIRVLAAPRSQPRERGLISLEAWPTYGWRQSTVRFEVPSSVLDEFYAKNSMNSVSLRMGDAGGCMVGELDPDIVAMRFLPMVAQYLVDLADARDLPDHEVLDTIGVHPTMWLMGIP
jgi:hypothetical protein